MTTEPYTADLQFQERILLGVSRTFAITIPQLPQPLRDVVGSAYLLCRIADTLEDDVALTAVQKNTFHEQFIAVVQGTAAATAFAKEVYPLLSATTLAAERELVNETARVIRLLRSYTARQQEIIARAVVVMGRGMPIYEQVASRAGLQTVHDLDKYCYYVAGVVGEMLTELFCEYSSLIAQEHAKLRWLAVSFGQALQMTNILKDIWEDYARGVCWLPQEIFQPLGITLTELTTQHSSAQFALGMQQLATMAIAHCRNALAFVQLLPSKETGIRRFCLRALVMAVLTLRKIYACPGYANKRQVTISRQAVQATLLTTNLFAYSNCCLLMGFRLLAHKLPLVPLSAEWEPSNLREPIGEVRKK